MRKFLQQLFTILLLEFSQSAFGSFSAESDVLFLLRIRDRSFDISEKFNYNSKEEIVKTAFDKEKPIIFQVHGYLENKDVKQHLELSKALLEAHDVNLFFIDWGKGSRTLDYSLAQSQLYKVARVLSEFIKFLHEKHGIIYKQITCIGFSMGAQICGNAGNYLGDQKIKKIIALDPAGPTFDANDPSTTVNKNSADYVECVFTSKRRIRGPVCQANFFFNGAIYQPGCKNFVDKFNEICSHYRAILYYVEALKNPETFFGKTCSDFEQALNKTCESNEGEFMGNDKNVEKKLSGIFQVKTNKDSPFGRGRD